MSELLCGCRSRARLRPSLRWSQSFICPRLFKDTTVPFAPVDLVTEDVIVLSEDPV